VCVSVCMFSFVCLYIHTYVIGVVKWMADEACCACSNGTNNNKSRAGQTATTTTSSPTTVTTCFLLAHKIWATLTCAVVSVNNFCSIVVILAPFSVLAKGQRMLSEYDDILSQRKTLSVSDIMWLHLDIVKSKSLRWTYLNWCYHCEDFVRINQSVFFWDSSFQRNIPLGTIKINTQFVNPDT